MDTTRNLDPVDARRMARRAVIAVGLGAAGAAVLPHPRSRAPPSTTDPAPDSQGTTRSTRPAIRVPLTMSLRYGVPVYPGDPPFTWHIDTDSRVAEHYDGGYLLEQMISLGTHTASRISARRTSSSTASA